MSFTLNFRSLALTTCLLASGIAAASSAACSAPKDESTESTEQHQTELDKADWLEKASRAIRNGDGLGPRDDVDALTAMSKEEAIDLFMKDARFGDMVLSFNLYYVGRAVERVKTPNPSVPGSFVYDQQVMQGFPQAVMSAKAVVDGGNYYDLYAASPASLRSNNGFGAATGDAGIDNFGRQRFKDAMNAAIDKTATDRNMGCQMFTTAGQQASQALGQKGFQNSFQINQVWLRRQPLFPRTLDCAFNATSTLDDVMLQMRTIRDSIDTIFDVMIRNPVPMKVQSLADVVMIPTDFEGLPGFAPTISQVVMSTLPGTSTNFHRKRSSYMLKTFFCDDLTPLSIPATETPDAGADGGTVDQHASNANCQACHYRLDPMGALFRNMGQNGFDFTGQNSITFDDFVTFQGDRYTQYLKTWQNPDGTFRAGYWILGRDGKPQREPSWTNEDGDTVRGLYGYMRRSKIVKSCLVKRLAEYVLGPKQVYDREWLAEISANLENGPTSAVQFKAVVKSLVLSKTFSTHDPQKGVCYDLPSDAPPNRSPCAIAHVVNTHCAGCHSSVDGPGHLDFSNWKDIGGGQFSWAHEDDDGVQLTKKESLKRMLDRITSNDREFKMPYMRTMPEEDNLTIREWLQQNLEP